MHLPWKKPEGGPLEVRDDSADYTSAIVAMILSHVSGQAIDPVLTGAVEVASGLWARAFASAAVSPRSRETQGLTPSILAAIGRRLVTRGEILLEVRVVRGAVQLVPSHQWDISGPPNPEEWIYVAEFAGPSETATRTLSADRVVHIQYSQDDAEPWRGVGPISHASLTAQLAGALETRLGEEAGQGVGGVIPVPKGQTQKLQEDLRNLGGKLALLESMSNNWDSGGQSPSGEYVERRIGASPPPTLATLRVDAQSTILAAAGIPVALLNRADGTLLREGYRQMLHSTILPVARMVEERLTARLDVDVVLNFDALMAGDVTGRARAFQSMVGAGMDVSKAAALSGLIASDDA